MFAARSEHYLGESTVRAGSTLQRAVREIVVREDRRAVVGRLSRDIRALHVSPRNEQNAHALALRAGRTCDDERPAFATRLIPRGYVRMRALRSLMLIQFSAHPPIRLDCWPVVDLGHGLWRIMRFDFFSADRF